MGRLFADKHFSLGTIDNALKAIWKNPKGFRTTEKGGNCFQFFFENEIDVKHIERGSPWLFKDYILHVQRWTTDDNPKEMLIPNFPIWAQFWGLPESYKTLAVARRLGGSIGDVLDTALFNVRGKESRIIKAKVKIMGNKIVRDSLKLTGPDQKTIEVAVRYERIGSNMLGEWVKAEQVGTRVWEKERNTSFPSGDTTEQLQMPKKRPLPACFLDSFSSMSVKDIILNKSKDSTMVVTKESMDANSPAVVNIPEEMMENTVVIGQNNHNYERQPSTEVDPKAKTISNLKKRARKSSNGIKTFSGVKRNFHGEDKQESKRRHA
ncbi:hypothetical protein PIB30_071883 [Stylosanthes scabra]|uniref:DUF4283 domain-containing protein n=1 Tax=Stylosanthes scabra TaxID=79078 RepID=A0ABU6VMB1_9FABA|nr:hypothetical protein [Stylosanthes scabra]